MQVLALGEVLIDMLGTPTTDPDAPTAQIFQPFAGGAPANVAVAVAKLGGHSALISKVGNDQFGRFLTNTLNTYQVDTQYVHTSEAKTALAFVSLDKDGERSFDFYLENAAHTQISSADTDAVEISDSTLIHLCSGSFSLPLLCQSAQALIARARQQHSLLCMDINYRPAFWSDDTATIAQRIFEAAAQMHIIKASFDELELLYGARWESVIEQWLAQEVQLVLLTNGPQPVRYYTRDYNGQCDVPATTVKDTTAAGDAFIGGFLYSLGQALPRSAQFNQWVTDRPSLLSALSFAMQCGAHTVTRFGAFEALPGTQDIN
ncbi:carbohydrate kinase [Salinimonas marina]|uniref:Carbohydrate kinase n=1 Tax=Salinimonas marina TaxID=2785918 RepID=A0A7S9HDC5_9ALTE|nr:carbohydrate kinase [Salinimonas marina]QPG06126.1 carbohydrate kinase [Salinimonas marina]